MSTAVGRALVFCLLVIVSVWTLLQCINCVPHFISVLGFRDTWPHPSAMAVSMTRWWSHALAPYLRPLVTGSAWWFVMGSIWRGSSSRTPTVVGQMMRARPRLGSTVKSSNGKFVAPPSSTSLFKYKKTVSIRTYSYTFACILHILQEMEMSNQVV